MLSINNKYHVFSLSNNSLVEVNSNNQIGATPSTNNTNLQNTIPTIVASSQTLLPVTSPTAIDFITSPALLDQPAPIRGWRCHCWNSTVEIQVNLKLSAHQMFTFTLLSYSFIPRFRFGAHIRSEMKTSPFVC